VTSFLRGLRGDLRLALRPACLLLLMGVAVTAGLSSAVMQDVSHAQVENARRQVRDRPWDRERCPGRPATCRDRRREAGRAARAFLAEQARVATRIGALQTLPGAVRYGSAFTGLATGAAVIALLATLTLGGEWIRGTIRLAFAGGRTPFALAARRCLALWLLGVGALAAAVVGALAAALWGQAARPLPAPSSLAVAKPLLGALALAAAYAALATVVAWRSRAPLPTLLFTLAVVGLAAVTTPLGSRAPGAAVPAALDLHRLLEVEVGYLWVWPPLAFPGGQASAVREVAGAPWGLATATILATAAALLLTLRWLARRSDPLT
jgi:hypothetical protein